MKNLKENKAITLIALVVTVVLLLVLAGVSINLSMGENGIIGKAQTAVDKYKQASQNEQISLAKYENEIDEFVEGDRDVVTIDVVEYKALKAKVDAMPVMHSPIYLVHANLPNTGINTRVAGTYKASSNSYTKSNESNFPKYLEFIENSGWKVLKSGWYYFLVDLNAETGVDGEVAAYLLINGNSIGGKLIKNWNWADSPEAYSNSDVTLWLSKDDVIDISYVIDKNKTQSWVDAYIYAMFE